MPLQKVNKQAGWFLPHYEDGVLAGFEVTVSYGIQDDDGSLNAITKRLDIWPFLTPQQQQTLTNLVQAITNLAVNRA